MGTLRLRSVPPLLLQLSLCGALVLARTIANAADPTGEVTAQTAQSDRPATDATTAGPRGKEPSSPQAVTKTAKTEEILVTGTHLELKKGEGAQEVQVYTQETIRRSGQTTVADFLSTLPSVSLIVDPGSLQTGNLATGVRLHGLPLGTTLVLIDGRRIETSATAAFNDIFDLTYLPLGVVDRIEVLPQGSSAIYGSDAIGGVVNIILKKNFDGFAGSAKYGAADGTSEFNTSLAWGGRWERAAFSVVGSFLTQSELTGKERPLTADANYTRFGSTDRRLTVGNPGNVFSVNGTNLPGLNAPYAAVPAGFVGTPSVSEFTGTAGQLNKFSEFSGFGLIPESNRIGLLANGTYDLSTNTQLYAQLLYSRVDQDQHLLPNGFLNGSPGFQSYTVSAANPFNPFGETVGIGYFFPGTYLDSFRTDYFLPSLGIRGQLIGAWTWELTAWDSLDNTEKTLSGQARASTLQAALNSPNPATALNPFVAGAPGSQQLIDSVLYADDQRYHGNSFTTSALLRGPVVALPGGDLTVALGSEFTRQILHVEDDAGASNPYRFSSVGRNAYAAYGEARVPIIGPRVDGMDDRFAITGAQRYDHFDQFGGKWTNQFGGEVRPLAHFLLRADWGRSFKAPSLYQLNLGQVITQQGIVDPLTGKTNGATVIAGGNPNLNPETGQSHSFGLVYSDGVVRGLDVSVTNWIVNLHNSIQALNPQVIVNNAGYFPGAVVRAPNCAGGPPCPIVSVNRTFTNFGDINAAGLDYLIKYRFAAAGVQWIPSVNATQTYRYTAAFQPGQPASNRVSQANDDGNWAPRWKGTTSLGFERGPWSGVVAGRYVGSYRDYDKLENGTYPHIGSIWYADANLRFQLESLGRASEWLRRMAVEIGGVNIFDRQPQFSTMFSGAYGFDILQADMRGRFLYVQLDKQL
jgi:iron complex outermembrane receptor protein